MGHPDLPIIILAAGASSRMRGRDKLLELVDGIPLIRRQALMARAVTSGPVLIALPPAPHARYDAMAGLDVTCLSIADAVEGMGASLRTAIGALPKETALAMVLLGDMPELTSADISKVIQAIDLSTETLIWRGALADGTAGHPIVFRAPQFDALAHLAGDSGGREVVAAARPHVCLVPLPGNHARLDLDTPEEWAEWRATQGHAAPRK